MVLFVKSRNFSHLTCICIPRKDSIEFYQDLWREKTRVARLSCGVVRVISLAVLLERRLLTDRQIDIQACRQSQDDIIYHASIASRGKQ